MQPLSNEQVERCRSEEENRKHNRCVENAFFNTTLGAVYRTGATKSASKAGALLLYKNARNESNSE